MLAAYGVDSPLVGRSRVKTDAVPCHSYHAGRPDIGYVNDAVLDQRRAQNAPITFSMELYSLALGPTTVQIHSPCESVLLQMLDHIHRIDVVYNVGMHIPC